jgi:hypothetical protein
MNKKRSKDKDLLTLLALSLVSLITYKLIKTFITYLIIINFFTNLISMSKLSLFVISSIILAISSIMIILPFYIKLRRQNNKYRIYYPLLFAVGLLLLELIIHLTIEVIQGKHFDLTPISPNLDFIIPLLIFCYLFFFRRNE